MDKEVTYIELSLNEQQLDFIVKALQQAKAGDEATDKIKKALLGKCESFLTLL